ncbi:hypothetical protein [Flavimaricola marinus]|uniref:Lipoprotein n=1 Tax=Flavimaricola marinus TaxID=1819565 RepID=A0A238LG37_9RHOB|nr:hypothetical protein [Flavimaricola marinus]SMY08578.1 hypothetical protein LOM8899_02732 [Flavimaricola marinus]
MMIKNAALAMALALGLAACETSTPTATPVSASAATGIDGVVAALQADVGKDIGGGVTLLSAEADGSTLRAGFQFVATVAQLEAIGRQEFEDGFTQGFVGSLCSNPAVPAFMASGGAVEVTMVDPAGAPILARRVTSC